jgi:cupin fold WbuC family metalloprotein
MMDLPVERINDEVFVASDPIVRLDKGAVDFVREQALRNPRGRARICAHRGNDDLLHEMLIGISGASYVRPHRHDHKSESFHLVEGEAEVVILSDDGEVEDVVPLGSEANFFYRLDTPRYHTLLLGSPVLVIHETTNGPFDPSQTGWAPFAPAEGTIEAAEYVRHLRQAVAAWKKEGASD